jgi:hypothetical protein
MLYLGTLADDTSSETSYCLPNFDCQRVELMLHRGECLDRSVFCVISPHILNAVSVVVFLYLLEMSHDSTMSARGKLTSNSRDTAGAFDA